MAGRAPSVVFSVEYFSAWRFLLHSQAAHVENAFGGRAGATSAGSVGRVHFAVFFADVWVADGILQLWSMAGDCNVAGNWAGQGRRARPWLDGTHASGAGRGWRRHGPGADHHALDFRQGARYRGYYLAAE